MSGVSELPRKLQLAIKRGLDIAGAIFGYLGLAPVFALVALCVPLDSPGNIFFKLRVAGRDGKAFDQWKFRTMVQNARDTAHRYETSARDPRITRAGRFCGAGASTNFLNSGMSFVAK
jgi:lipopolysaccharide/colanic/teichoic acid biosynthesis glycosyltransferase